MTCVSRYAKLSKRLAALLIAGSLTLTGCGMITSGGTNSLESPAGHYENGMPKATVWTGYPVGTLNYAEQAAVAEVLIKDYKTQVRMIGSDSGLGRVTPLRTGQAQAAGLSDEAFYAFKAKYEFVAEDWGPQALRTFWTPPTTVTVGVADNSDFHTL